MDPNEALKQIRAKMARIQAILDNCNDRSGRVENEDDLDEMEELTNEVVDLWNGLDRWMSMAGALPDDWAKGR